MVRRFISLAFIAGCSEAPIVDQGGGGGEATGGNDGGESSAFAQVSIEVVDERGLPGAGLDVLSHTASGALYAGAATDDDGHAVLEVPADGLVSVLSDRNNPDLEAEERTIQSVKLPAGRTTLRFVTFESQPKDDARQPMGPILLDFGNGGMPFVLASCAGKLDLTSPTNNTVTLENYRGCPGSDVFDLFAFRTTLDGDNFVVTHTAAISGQPFTPGESATISFDWQPASLGETVWHLSGISDPADGRGSAWWTAKQPYALIPELAHPAFDPLEDTIVQPTTGMPAELQCVHFTLDQEGGSCKSGMRTVCGEAAPATIDWATDRLAVPVLDASAEAWTHETGELGDYFEVRTIWGADDGAHVMWSLLVDPGVPSRPLDFELPGELAMRFGRAGDAPPSVFVSNIDVDDITGFDDALDAYGVVPSFPALRELSWESVYGYDCAN